MKFGIVVDSSSDLYTKDFQSELFDFSIVPLNLTLGQKDYVDDDNLDIENFVNKMEQETGSMSSSCPSPGAFVQAYDKSDNVICFALTSQLSGCYNSAVIAKDLSLADNPNKNILVVDSKTTAGSLILLVEKTIELIKKGYEFDLISEEILAYQKEMYLDFTLGSYKMLVSTGRMNPIVGGVASTLNIRPIAEATRDGAIKVIKKVHGVKKLYKELLNDMVAKKDISNKKIYIHHCYNEVDAMKLKDLILNDHPNSIVVIRECKGLTSFYAQRGGIIVSF